MAATTWPARNADLSSAGSAKRSTPNTIIATTTVSGVPACSSKTKARLSTNASSKLDSTCYSLSSSRSSFSAISPWSRYSSWPRGSPSPVFGWANRKTTVRCKWLVKSAAGTTAAWGRYWCGCCYNREHCCTQYLFLRCGWRCWCADRCARCSSDSDNFNANLSGSEGLLGHYVIEVLPANLTPVRSRSLQHLLQLLDIHRLAQLFRHPLDIVGVDHSGVVVVEEVEDLIDAVLN